MSAFKPFNSKMLYLRGSVIMKTWPHLSHNGRDLLVMADIPANEGRYISLKSYYWQFSNWWYIALVPLQKVGKI